VQIGGTYINLASVQLLRELKRLRLSLGGFCRCK
jgi:hypothetical protein